MKAALLGERSAATTLGPCPKCLACGGLLLPPIVAIDGDADKRQPEREVEHGHDDGPRHGHKTGQDTKEHGHQTGGHEVDGGVSQIMRTTVVDRPEHGVHRQCAEDEEDNRRRRPEAIRSDWERKEGPQSPRKPESDTNLQMVLQGYLPCLQRRCVVRT